MDILSHYFRVTTIDYPYKIWIIDDFLKSAIVDKILKEWPSHNLKGWNHGYANIENTQNKLESGMAAMSKVEDMPEFIKQIVLYFHTQEFVDTIANLIKVDGLVPDISRRWGGIREMHPGSFQLIHSDARKSLETSLRKEITGLLYFNLDYDKKIDAGCLEIWDDKLQNKVHEIEPLMNRMVLFLNSDTSYHGVPKVNTLRRSITFSFLKRGTAENRYKALFVKRPEDPNEITELGIMRSKVKDRYES